MFPGNKMPKKSFNLRKLALGSYLRGPMLNVMAKKSTDTNFKCKQFA